MVFSEAYSAEKLTYSDGSCKSIVEGKGDLA